MKTSLLHCILSFVFIANAMAAIAVFSPDGKFVTLIPLAATSADLWRVDVKTKAIENISLGLPKDQFVISLANGADGELLLLTKEAVYVHDAKGTKKLCDTTGVKDADNLSIVPPKASNGMADWIIVTGIDPNSSKERTSHIYFARKPGEKQFSEVFGRRIPDVAEGAFNKNGAFFFISDDAIWEGSFSHWPDQPPDQWQVNLTSTSIAPLAYCDSNFSNTGEYKVGETIAVAGQHVYTVLGGRHGAGVLLRVTMPGNIPPANGTDSGEALAAHYAMQGKVLSSVEVLQRDSSMDLLTAVSIPGEERVFYIAHPHYNTTQMMMWSSVSKVTELSGELKDEDPN